MVSPERRRPCPSVIMDAMTGRPVALAQRVAAAISRTVFCVSTKMPSTPAAARDSACMACSRSSASPSGVRSGL